MASRKIEENKEGEMREVRDDRTLYQHGDISKLVNKKCWFKAGTSSQWREFIVSIKEQKEEVKLGLADPFTC